VAYKKRGKMPKFCIDGISKLLKPPKTKGKKAELTTLSMAKEPRNFWAKNTNITVEFSPLFPGNVFLSSTQDYGSPEATPGACESNPTSRIRGFY